MFTKENFQQLLKEGKYTEYRFANDFCYYEGGNMIPSDVKTDRFKHIDLWYDKEGQKRISFDVKGLKKDKRFDTSYNPDIVWIEIQDVAGKRGWLYGDEDYIVFEQIDDWLIISRKKLIKIIENLNINKTITNDVNKALYRYYQRKNAKDIVVKIYTDIIRKNANKIINKLKNI